MVDSDRMRPASPTPGTPSGWPVTAGGRAGSLVAVVAVTASALARGPAALAGPAADRPGGARSGHPCPAGHMAARPSVPAGAPRGLHHHDAGAQRPRRSHRRVTSRPRRPCRRRSPVATTAPPGPGQPAATPAVATWWPRSRPAGIDPGPNWSWSIGDTATGAAPSPVTARHRLHLRGGRAGHHGFRRLAALALVAHELANAETENDAVPACDPGHGGGSRDVMVPDRRRGLCLVAHFMGFQDDAAGPWQCPAALADRWPTTSTTPASAPRHPLRDRGAAPGRGARDVVDGQLGRSRGWGHGHQRRVDDDVGQIAAGRLVEGPAAGDQLEGARSRAIRRPAGRGTRLGYSPPSRPRTRRFRRRPSPRNLVTGGQGAQVKNTPGPVELSTWPRITAEPTWPGVGPRSNQPGCRTVVGTWTVPSAFKPRDRQGHRQARAPVSRSADRADRR